MYTWPLYGLSAGIVLCIVWTFTGHIYAYRYGNTEGRCDNDEHGASAKLLKLIKDQDVTDSIVIVTRWFGGVHIGPKRFTLIENCASDALKLLT